jgi:hypothetical protein
MMDRVVYLLSVCYLDSDIGAHEMEYEQASVGILRPYEMQDIRMASDEVSAVDFR